MELSGAPLPVPLGTAGASSALPASLPPARELGLWAVYNSILKTRKFVDLTHAFDPNIPHWKGFEAETVATKYSYDSDGVCMCKAGVAGSPPVSRAPSPFEIIGLLSVLNYTLCIQYT